MKELITVIIPCYNVAKFLPETLESLRAQTYRNWECIIVDDGSTDGCEEIALQWKSKDDRIKYVKKKNEGPSAARNVGIQLAKGSFFQFLDGDDIIHPEKFEIQIKSLSNSPKYALSISDYFSSMEHDVTLEHPWYLSPKFKSTDYLCELAADWETNLSIPIHCFLFKAAIFTENRIFFIQKLKNHVDWECWMNIFKLNPKVYYVDKKLATYRRRSNSICSDEAAMKIGYLQAINIQKKKFSYRSSVFKALQAKENYLKYGLFTRNKVEVLKFRWKKFLREL